MVECVKAKYSMLVVKIQEGCQGPAGCSWNNCAKTKREWDVEKTKQGAEPCKITGRSYRNGGLSLAALGKPQFEYLEAQGQTSSSPLKGQQRQKQTTGVIQSIHPAAHRL